MTSLLNTTFILICIIDLIFVYVRYSVAKSTDELPTFTKLGWITKAYVS